jgi:alcohol dehydrogenase (cytochrome c)
MSVGNYKEDEKVRASKRARQTGLRMWALVVSLWLAGAGTQGAWGQVTYERLLKAADEPHNWFTYSGDYSGRRYNLLKQIHTGNVEQLAVHWVFQTRTPDKFEATPLVIDGIMYLSAPEGHAYALDAGTGRLIWSYQYKLPDKMPLCCGLPNRGLAALGDKVFLATLDAHVVALDSKTGDVVWDVAADDYRKGYSFTSAPLVVKDKVVVGVSGGEYGIRGFIDAYDAETGKRAWRFYTIPGPGEPGNETWAGDSWKTGGAPAWLTGSYDPELNLIYWGIGNPGAVLYGGDRKGDNLYSDSVVALDADTGKLRWYYQFTPHDLHDWDAAQIPVLLDMEYQGRPRKLLAFANRNGFFYLLDRTDGKFLLGKPFIHVTWANEIGPDGRPVLLPNGDPTEEGTYICPGPAGGTNWMSPSFHPQTGYLYVPTHEECQTYFSSPQKYQPGQMFFGSTFQTKPGEKGWGAVRAIDPLTGEIKWEFKHHSPPWAGTLATAGGLVLTGDHEGYLLAFDAKSGKHLWHLQTGSPVVAAPMTYALDDKQYVVIPSGGALFALALPDGILAKEGQGKH